jgi:hypothetical protein
MLSMANTRSSIKINIEASRMMQAAIIGRLAFRSVRYITQARGMRKRPHGNAKGRDKQLAS